MSFTNTLIYWYLQNKRELPWRTTRDPYNIWLSEVILQQTRVSQGMEYYHRFIKNFPSIFELAAADEQTVLKLWQGLGYYSRARNLHFSARYVVNVLNGEFPTTYKELIKLKGIGDYTASAIASICSNEPVAVVDGNVYRVLARYFGIKTPINTAKGIKYFKELAQELIDISNPGEYNQAIMEFGAIQCKPRNPNCDDCPLHISCIALKEKRVDSLPVKENKVKVKKRYFNYLVINTMNNQTVIEQRKENDIWKGLYQFPLVETIKEINSRELLNSENFQKKIPNSTASVKLLTKKPVIHKLSHQHLVTNFWLITIEHSPENAINWGDIYKYPVPVLIHNFVKKFKPIA